MKMRLIATFVLILIALLAIGFTFRRPLFGHLHSTIQNPEKTFQLEVYSYPQIFSMPGQGSDASGYILLRRISDHSVINSSEISMVQLADSAKWASNKVEIKFVADWPLQQQ